MHAITATFEVVTPMFLGGADNKATTELRATSIKGQLRFWWRALAWGRIGDLKQIHKEEARIFGSADNGQGRFLLRIVNAKLRRQSSGVLTYGSQNKVVMPGARYLAYGLMKAFGHGAGTLERPCIREESEFTIELRFSKPSQGKSRGETEQIAKQHQEDAGSVLQALQLFGFLGGLGSRTRRGWGSVALVELAGDGVSPKWSPPADEDDYGECIKNIVGAAASCSSPPEYSAFFKNARILIIHTGVTALDALGGLGDKFQLFRGWRHPSGGPEQNFKPDHDGFKVNTGSWKVSPGSFEVGYPAVVVEHPLRAALGLPHNYSQKIKIEAEIHDRRASPLLFHIHRIGNKFATTATVFPTPFLPDVTKNSSSRPERIKIINGRHETLVANQVDYRIIDAFLDGFTAAGGEPRTYFPAQLRIL